MNTTDLGKKIKEARIAKKMTQSEVVGTFITRNMLSQIESGAAMPSIKTLEYLAKVLELPITLLIDDESDDPIETLFYAKKLLQSKEYTTLLAMKNTVPDILSDEFYALFTLASFQLAKKSFNEADYRAALRYAQEAIDYAGAGLYANEVKKSESIRLFNASAEKLKEQNDLSHTDSDK